MSTFQVVATRQVPLHADARHARIVGVQARHEGGRERYWPIDQVADAIRHGDRFFTQTSPEQVPADVTCYRCYGHWVLRSRADGADANNLNSLPRC
jgi:hypothetical protein